MEDLKLQILSALGLNKEEEVKFETQAKLTDGTIIVSSADSLEAGVDVSILTEDGTTMPLPAGKYETEDGVGFSVEEEGIIAEIYEEETEETEEVAEEEEVEAEAEDRQPKKIKETKEVEFDKEGLINEIGAVIKELLNEVKSDIARLSSELDEMKGNNDDLQDLASTLETEKAELESQVKDLSKEPAEKPIKVSKFNKTGKVKEKPYSQMSVRERYIYNLNK